MAATITSTADRITISGNYKAFTSTTGSTSTVIQYSTGDAPASGDAGRFLLWKNGSNTGNWEVRYIESATATTVTVGDGGFSSAPSSGENFSISTSLADIDTALADTIVRSSGRSYQIIDRDFALTSNAFVADVNASLSSKSTHTGSGFIATYPVANNCVLQFGRLVGGEANDSTETIEGCQLLLEVSNDTLMFTNQVSFNSAGCVLNFYGCLIESIGNGNNPFIRAPGPMRIVGCVCDGPMGGRLYSSASELVDTRFSGNLSGGVAWSLGASFTRAIENAFFYQNQAAVKSFQAFTGTFSNTRFADSNTYIIEASAQSGLLFRFIDCTTFDVSKINNNTGNYEQLKSINYSVTDSSGVGLTGVKVAVYDNSSTIQDAIRTSSSGNVSAINARFFRKNHNVSTPVNYAPFDIRIRKYGYEYQDFQSAVSEPIKQEFRLPSNTVTALSEAAAAALTFITIDFSLKTVTVQRSRTLSEIYDYCQSQLALDANMDEPEFITSSDGNVFTFADDWDLILDASGAISSASGKTVAFGGTGVLQMLDDRNTIDNLNVIGDIDLGAAVTPLTGITAETVDFSVAGTYTVDGCTFDEVTNSSGGSVTLELINGSTITTNTGPSIALSEPVDVVAANIIDASRVQIYNVTKGAELDNSVVSGGSGYSFTANLASAGVDDGDTLRLRAEYQSGTDARDSLEATGIITASGLSFLNTQENDTIYNAFGIDGSTVTGYTADYIDDEVDISVATTFSIKELYAWWVFNKSTSQGISDFAGGVTAETASIIRVNTAVVNIFLDNSTTNWIIQSDDVRWYRDDEAYPIKRPTTGGGCIDVEWRRDVALAQSAEVTAIKATVDANLDATVSSRSTQTSVDNLNNLSALDVATELATYDAPTKAEMDAGFSALNNFDPASDTVTVGSTSEDSIVDKVWDEVIDNANHNTAKSAGKRIRQAGASLSAEGTVDDPSPTVSSFITDLTQTNTSFYADQTMIFLSGDLEGQARLITSYNGTTKVVTFDEPWTVAPANTDEFEIKADHVHPVTEIQTGLATAASIAALNNLSEAQVNAQADLALTDYDAPTKAELDAAKSSIEALIVALNNLSEAQVNAQVDTALNDYDAPTKAELDLVEAKVDIALAQATLARKHLTNRDKIDTATNKLIRYDDDGTSPMLQFNLKDKNGDPASDNIYEKTPI